MINSHPAVLSWKDRTRYILHYYIDGECGLDYFYLVHFLDEGCPGNGEDVKVEFNQSTGRARE
jgi:hypothetical protein